MIKTEASNSIKTGIFSQNTEGASFNFNFLKPINLRHF